MTLKIKPDNYPMAYPLKETIGICDTGDINDPEELQILISILNHEYLHTLLYRLIGFFPQMTFSASILHYLAGHLEGDEANIALDNLPIDIEDSL